MKTTKMRAKFQEICLGVRHWLIRKLGGYTEQRISPFTQTYMAPPPPIHMERVTCNARANPRHNLTPDEEKRYMEAMREELLYSCVEKLIRENFYVLTCAQDSMGWRVYSLTLGVVPPSEWVKTSLGDHLSPGNRGRRMTSYRGDSENQTSHP